MITDKGSRGDISYREKDKETLGFPFRLLGLAHWGRGRRGLEHILSLLLPPDRYPYPVPLHLLSPLFQMPFSLLLCVHGTLLISASLIP